MQRSMADGGKVDDWLRGEPIQLTLLQHRLTNRQHMAEQPVWLPVATAETGKLNRAALSALGAIWRDGHACKKAGATLVDLVAASDVQGGLFDTPDAPRDVARMKALDALNAKFGRGTVT